MDTLLHALLSWQFLFFSLAIGIVIFVIRQLVEYGMDNWWPLKQWKAANKDAKLWRGLILPILPIVLGLTAALFAKAYPFPEGFSSTSGRVVFGLVSGFTSGLAVRIYKSFLSSSVSEYSSRISTFVKLKRDNKRDNHDHNHSDDCRHDEVVASGSDCDKQEDLEASVRDSIKRDE